MPPSWNLIQEPKETRRVRTIKEEEGDEGDKDSSKVECEIDTLVMHHIYQYRSDHETSFETEITHNVFRSIIQNSETTDRKAISKELMKHNAKFCNKLCFRKI